jgi:hypothetical protein
MDGVYASLYLKQTELENFMSAGAPVSIPKKADSKMGEKENRKAVVAYA